MIVNEEHIRPAREKIEQDRVDEVIKTLPTTSAVYNMYKQLCSMVETDYLTHRRITNLIAELDMLSILHTIAVSNERCCWTKEITLSVYSGKLKAMLEGLPAEGPG